MLIEKAKDAAFWEKVRTAEAYRPFVDELLSLWERECTGEIPACKYSEFIIYNQTGSRKEYEAKKYMVVVPEGVKDIVMEGKDQSHCLGKGGRYFERIERRETYVLFLRKRSRPKNHQARVM